MYLNQIAESRPLAEAAFTALDKYEIAPTPENYALWYEYHAGTE